MSKQHPEEESFKDKILNSLNNSGETADFSTNQKNKVPPSHERLQISQDAVGSRRSQAAGKKSKTTESPKSTSNKSGYKSSKTGSTTAKKKNTVVNQADSVKSKKPPQKELSEKKQEERLRKSSRDRENRVVNRIVTIVVITLLFVGGILGFYVYRYISAGLKPLNSAQTEKVTVEIPRGSSNKAIGEILENEKVIKSGMVFNYYTKFNNLTGFQAGKYSFSPNMTLDEISKELMGGTGTGTADMKLTIPEGYTIDQIGDAVEKNLKLKKKDFIDLMKDESFFNELHKKYPELLDAAAKAEGVRYRLEGYLFPATYDYYNGTDLKEFVTQMVEKTNSVMSQYYQTIKDKQLNVQEVLTLASLVEKEGNNESDRRKIAQVFFNRLAAPMPLQSDISILYALGEHKELVTNADTQVDSPYNLYVNRGYGPGPFDNPSEQSIKAVLNPQQNDYYYFVADIKTGQVYYARTFEEHNALVEQYVNNTDTTDGDGTQ